MKISLDKENFQLIKEIGSGNFSTVYQTQLPEFVAKITYKSNPKAFNAFKVEWDLLKNVKSEGLVQFRNGGLSTLNGQQVGVLIIEKCSNGSLIDMMISLPNNKPPEQVVLMVLRDVLRGLITIHQQGYIHRDVKMENVLLTSGGQFKLCDFGSATKVKYAKIDNSNRDYMIEDMEGNTTPFYRAPEYIDTYAGYPIDERVDIFALGVLAFIFCFQKPPFDTGLAAVNSHYFIPQNHGYSQKLIQLIISLFTVDPCKRPFAKELLAKIQKDWNIGTKYVADQKAPLPNLTRHFNSVDNVYIEKKETPLGILDKVKRYFNTLSKKTDAWVEQATENDDNPPRLEDMRSLIIKAWLKKEKIEKFYESANRIMMTNLQHYRVILKLEILLHSYIKKGPTEVMEVKKQQSTSNCWIIIKNLNTTFNHKYQQQSTKETKILKLYANLLQSKLNLCFENKNLFEASFSLSPLLMALQNGNFWQAIDTKLLESFLDYWKQCLEFGNLLLSVSSLWKIQTVAIMLIVDEVYSLLSMFLHLWVSIKQTTNSNETVDVNKLTEWVLGIDAQFEANYASTQDFMQRCTIVQEFKEIARYIPKLPHEVIQFLNRVEFLKGENKIQLNPQNQIFGIKIPISYAVTVQNLQQQLLSTTSFDKQKQEVGDLQKSAEFFADFGFFNTGNQQNQNAEFDQPWPTDQKWTGDQQWPNFSLANSQVSQQVPQEMKQSNQTEIDASLLQQVLFKFDYDRTNEIDSARFPYQGQQIVQSDIISFQNPTFQVQQNCDLLNQEQIVVKASTQNVKPNNEEILDLLNFDELQSNPEPMQIPLDLNFNINTNNTMSQESKPHSVHSKSNPQSLKSSPNKSNKQESINASPIQQKLIIDKVCQLLEGQVDLKEVIIQFEELVLLESIGNGSSCIVYKGYYRSDLVAIKELDISKLDDTAIKEFRRETLTLIKASSHPYLVSLVGISYNDNKVYIVTEYCENGTLFELIHRQRELEMDWPQKILMCKQVAMGMQYLHSLDLIHRDLKSLNLLLKVQQNQQVVKIADFGLSRSMENNELMTAVVGTFHWMAPEVFEGEQYSQKADVYSYGIVIYEICSREIPYKHMQNPMQIMKYVVEKKQRPDLNFECPILLKDLMQVCWHADPNCRPNFNDIVETLMKI